MCHGEAFYETHADDGFHALSILVLNGDFHQCFAV